MKRRNAIIGPIYKKIIIGKKQYANVGMSSLPLSQDIGYSFLSFFVFFHGVDVDVAEIFMALSLSFPR